MNLIITFFFSLVACWLISMPVIWALKVFKIGQNIRQEGPSTHLLKAGTPTMGGIPILITILIFVIILINIDIDIKYFALILLFLAYAALGFLDDLIKIKQRQNLGLTERQKFFWQFVFAAIFASILIWRGHNADVDQVLRFFHFNSPWLYFPFVVFIIIGGANAVNLTDGLDGLAASTITIASAALAVLAYNLQLTDPGIIAATTAGATLAFLWFNIYPAEVFMGDVGSMGLGALLSGLAILIHKELIFAIIGGIFVLEALSVIAQVASFKFIKRRIFRMTPLHHHFELMGIAEPIVVLIFIGVGLIFAAAGIWLNTVF